MANQNDDVIYSRVLIQKIAEHKDQFGIPDDTAGLQLMALSDYRDMVNREAFFFVDHNGFLRSQFSGEILAASKEHIDILIEQLQKQRKLLDEAMDCAKE
ncbi:hypothetical protein [Pectobacterium carotovorum]|uniref:hypothetical protein n=1 Tax=Pectobacterium carotovorum TaxID=554 RepID=UPI002A836EB1|nr:hypothetical protein [Pectobacterium carotovorum]MDY4375036.1 hypothetical protein [Pectobacterium carotovorum subsp. carotovorum]